MKDKKIKLRTKVFRFVILILFITFLTLFISNKNGYYEYQKKKQTTLTAEQIKQFEQDVKDGKEVDIESYLANTNPNYQTKLSKMGLNISDSVSEIVKKGVESFFNQLNKLVTE